MKNPDPSQSALIDFLVNSSSQKELLIDFIKERQFESKMQYSKMRLQSLKLDSTESFENQLSSKKVF